MLKKILKIIGWFFGIIILLLVGLILYIRAVGKIDPPVPDSLAVLDKPVLEPDAGFFIVDNNWFRRSESGLYELYVEGNPFERGVINGKLTKNLVYYQEQVFTEQINEFVPSGFYRDVLRYFLGYFNRDLDEYVPEEFKMEIYGVSQAASPEFNDIASPYQRMLNYHAAHDIGHALQNMSLVGCTSFATWDGKSEDSTLIIGRNFDFYVGDDFARNKIIAFYNPEKGHKFMMVTFGGMTGVLSGMNEHGLTVTINAAKSEIPSGVGTPVSLVAREILQYASTISEAFEIAKKRKTFVAESFLIGSANDGRAALIEKSPEHTELFQPDGDELVCANHFQSKTLGDTPLNREHVRTNPSPYRHNRVRELLSRNERNSVLKTAAILRDQKGLGDKDVGLGNEKVINQLLAHHAVIFQPEKRLVWISTSPWQMGKFVCYDLNKVFSTKMERNTEIYETDKTIAADPFLLTREFESFLKYSKFRFPFASRRELNPDSVVTWNPDSYHAYMIAGDHLMTKGEYQRAADMYAHGLTKEIASLQERAYMENKLSACKEKAR